MKILTKKRATKQKAFSRYKTVFARYKKVVAPIAIACALAAVASQSTDACGPFSKIAIFVTGNHPDFPLIRFAAGELGVLNQDYARSYLVVAYRHLAGIKTSPEKQREFVALWHRRLNTLDVEVQYAIGVWAAERKKVLGAKAKNVDAYDTNVYSGYLTYNADAFTTATETLKAKIKEYGPGDERVQKWLASQDQVFGITANADSSGTAPATAAGATPDAKLDTNYQKACDDFYSQRYDAAAEKFQAMAKDASSPWHQWGDYLAARSYCRKATMGDVVIGADLKRAKELVEKVLHSKDNAKMHAPAKRLLSFIEYRLDPSARAKQVVADLTTDDAHANLTEALGDYTLILDKVLEKETADSNKTSYRFESKFFATSTMAAALGLSAPSINLVASAPTVVIAQAKDASATPASSSPASSPASATPASATPASTTPASATPAAPVETLPSAGDVVFHDDMTAWILNFQERKPAALDKALAVWGKSKSLPWLVSVVSKISSTHPRRAEVVAEALKVSSDSPAYPTIQFHLIRLLIEENKRKEAAASLASLLTQVGSKLPPSARNGLFEMGVSCAGSIAEFVKLAAPSPAVVTWDYDSNELPEAIMDFEPGTVKLKDGDNYLSYPGCLTSPSSEIVNELAPLQTYVTLATNPALPPLVRLDLAQAGWTRSVMLKNEKMAMTLSPVLGKLRPQLSKSLTAYDAAATGRDKEFAALITILRNPRMRPFVTPGLDRETPFDKIDSFRNNWWEDRMPVAPQNMYVDSEEKKKVPPSAQFLSATETAQGQKEAAAIVAQGTAPNNLAQRVLALSKVNPKDPRLPEMLHLVVTTTRYGNTDDKTTSFSKQAFQALHRNFPGNEWTKKTKFWF